MFFFKSISYLPFWALYLIADLIAFVANYLLRYRKKVVLDNLRHAFPEKSEKEIRKITNQFYKAFADTIVETLKSLTISKEELLRRVGTDVKVFPMIKESGRSVFVMGSHIFNWEWFFLAHGICVDIPAYGIYQKLNNKFFDKLMFTIRARFGTSLIERGEVLRQAIRTKDEQNVYATLADLRPVDGENKYWTEFMNRDAAFFMGTEKLARKLNFSVVYYGFIKIKRGYYKSETIIIDEPPFETKPFDITEKYIRLVEKDIRRNPSCYLWSHKRWKHKRPKADH